MRRVPLQNGWICCEGTASFRREGGGGSCTCISSLKEVFHLPVYLVVYCDHNGGLWFKVLQYGRW